MEKPTEEFWEAVGSGLGLGLAVGLPFFLIFAGMALMAWAGVSL